MDWRARFVPQDRRRALATGTLLPDHATGTALLADLRGYTALSANLAARIGPQRGAEEVSAILNRVYDALISEIDHYGGSVIGFAGDAITCWFDDTDGKDAGVAGASVCRAARCGLALQDTMRAFTTLPLAGGGIASLALKCALAAGPARRFLVGNPQIQFLDVLAGPVVARLGLLGALAQGGEVLVDAETAALLAPGEIAGGWRTDASSGLTVLALASPPLPDTRPAAPVAAGGADLTEAQVRPWLLPAVWERLHHDTATFLPELRPVVALFLRFGTIDYTRPAAGSRLDTYIRWVQSVVQRYAGNLLEITIDDKGSYLYIPFGAPVAHADEAARAVAAALELRVPPPECGYIRQVQIGIAQGVVWAGPVGGRGRQTYAVIGDPVSLAARLMQAAAPGGILATTEVRAAAGGRFAWERMPALAVKGQSAPVPVWGLIAVSTGERMGLAEPAFHTALVGRTAERSALATALAQAREGQGRIVAISGEAGLGKSRLVADTVVQAQAAGFVTYGGAAQSYGTQSAYLAWQPIWRAFFDLGPDGTPAEWSAELHARLAAIDPALCERVPLLGTALGVALADTALTAGMDAALRKSSLEALLITCVKAVPEAGPPILLAIEDAHWLDPLSADLLLAVGRAIDLLPVLVLLAYRPTEDEQRPIAAIATLPYYVALSLTPLTGGEAGTLVAAHLGLSGGTPGQAANLAELTGRAAGNPFYLEELLHYLADRGIDPRSPEALADLEWPASLQSLLLARIDQLSEEQRNVMKVASIIGRRFRRAQLWGVFPDLGSPDQVSAALASLDRLGLTPLESGPPDWVYLFKHIVTQEVTYGSLPQVLRTRLHGQFAEWLETTAESGTRVAPDLLAYHYSRSADSAKAHIYLQQAGNAAAAAYNNVAAVQYYRRWLDLGPAEEQPVVLLALAAVLERTGEWEVAADYYGRLLGEGEECEAASGTLEAVAPLVVQRWAAALALGRVRWKQGNWAEAVRWLESARAGYAAAGDVAGVGRALVELGCVEVWRGEYATARVALEASLAYVRQAGDRVAEARALHNMGLAARGQGEYETARSLYEAGWALRTALGDRVGVAASLLNLGVLAAEQGDYPRARDLWEQSLALSRALGDRPGIASCLNNLGELARLIGDFEAARTHLQESLALARELGDRGVMGDALNNLALVELEEQDWLPARGHLEESLALKRLWGDRTEIADTLSDLAMVAWVGGDQAVARAYIAESLALCRALDAGALTLPALVVATGLLGTPVQQARWLGAATALQASRGLVLEPPTRRIYDQTSKSTQAVLGAPAYAAAFEGGKALVWEAVLDEVLAALGTP